MNIFSLDRTNSLSVWRSAWILQKTQLSVKIVFQVKMSKRKEVEKGKQQLESLQRIRNLDDKWQWHVDSITFTDWNHDTVIVWTMRQLITLWYVTTNRKSCWIRSVIIGVSVIKRFSLYEFSLWGRDFVSVVRIIEGPYYRGYFYKECMGIFPGPNELSVLERCPY